MTEHFLSIPAGVWVDILALFLLLVGIWQGKHRGFKAECIGAVAFLAATALVWWLHPHISQWVATQNIWQVQPHALRGAMFIVTCILFFILALAAASVFNIAIPGKLEPETDRALGLFPGLLRGIAYALAALLVVGSLSAETKEKILKTSHVGRHVLPRLSLEKIPAQLKLLAPETAPEEK